MSQPASSVATMTPILNGPRHAPDASRTRQGRAVDHFHLYMLWTPLKPAWSRQVIATTPDFDEATDAYHRRLARFDGLAPTDCRVFHLATELAGALVVTEPTTYHYWVEKCDQPEPGSCRSRERGWYDRMPFEAVRPLEDPA